MTDNLYQKLHAGGLISDESLQKITLEQQKPKLFSLHWEVRSLLYIGILTLTSGLGILVYQNVDTIGHQAILAFIALICAGSFYYCFKKRQPFQRGRLLAPNPYLDYVLLLACTSMLIFIGYLQYTYEVFGTNYNLATFIPMVILFGVAYYFDHLGILSMAIVNLALWMGVSVTPKALLKQLDFDGETIIYTYLVLGAVLLAGAMFTQRYQFKGHFKFSYQHYGVHVVYIALLSGHFHFYRGPVSYLYLLALYAFSVYMYLDARRHRSFYFATLVIIYTYIALTSMVFKFAEPSGELAFSLLMLYFALTGVGFVLLLIYLNKKFKTLA